ncbi:MAG: FHA domain-containing protein [Bacteriovoracaceae bacterium]
MSSAKNVLVLKHFEAPKKAGLHFRLLCMTGKSKGESYFITGNRIIIGRSDKADIQVFDTKSSREHAEVTKVGSDFVVTDLKSQNGIMVNDLKVTQQKLKDGDKLIVGQTVFRFGKVDVAEGVTPKKPSSVEDNFQTELKEEEKKKSKLPLIIVGLGLVLAFLLMEDTGYEQTKDKNNKINLKLNDYGEDFSSSIKKKQLAEDKDLKEKLDAIFHRGLREVREGNYYRGINEFNLALILSPNNARASFYRSKTIQLLDEAIEENFIKARRQADALKYKGASTSYCQIIRLLQNTPDDQRYKDAKANITEIEKTLGLNDGEIKCISQ